MLSRKMRGGGGEAGQLAEDQCSPRGGLSKTGSVVR